MKVVQWVKRLVCLSEMCWVARKAASLAELMVQAKEMRKALMWVAKTDTATAVHLVEGMVAQRVDELGNQMAVLTVALSEHLMVAPLVEK